MKYVATFISAFESYEFPEALEHNKQHCNIALCECAFSGFAESFYWTNAALEKTQRIWLSTGEGNITKQTAVQGNFISLLTLLDCIFIRATVCSESLFVSFLNQYNCFNKNSITNE